MGDSKFKLPKPTLPDFMDKAKKTVERATNNLNIPDFSKKASEKFADIKKQIENPDTDQLMSIIEKFNAARNISNVAKALGINLEEDQVQHVIDKKYELENAVASKTIGAVTSFMEKEGYHIDSPEKMLTDVTKRMEKGDDPLSILKNTAEPFTAIIKDTLNGNHTISINLDTSQAKEKVVNEAKRILTDKSIEEKVRTAGESISNLTSKAENIQLPKIDISADAVQAEVEKRIDNFKIDSSIPEHIQRLIEKYKITGGN